MTPMDDLTGETYMSQHDLDLDTITALVSIYPYIPKLEDL